jgi:DNA (cytosine-5)-methyltransferase 1
MIPNHHTKQYAGLVLDRLKLLPPGGRMGDLPLHLQHESFIRTGDKKTGGPNMRLLRLEMDKPSLTVTAYIFNKFVHPSEDRYITPREAACLQDFPIDFEFKGTLGEVHKQIGNAVPVKLATAIAIEVRAFLKKLKMSGDVSIASYFCGAGGFDLGFEMASDEDITFHTKFCTDIEKSVEQTILANRAEWGFVRADIRELNPSNVIAAIGGSPDIVIGGPPCQPFSVAGKQKATDDPLGTLYRDYIRHIHALQPKIVVMENVYGMAQVKSVNMIAEIYKSFNDIGYEVRHKELLSSDYATPQKRRRLFFIAAKSLKNFNFPEPSHSDQNNLFNLKPYEGAGKSFLDLPPPIVK